MQSPRRWFFALALVSVLCAGAAYLLMAASQQAVGMVILDMSSVLRRDGTISQSQFDQLADNIARGARPAFVFQMAVPTGLFLSLAVIQLIAGLRCPRIIGHAAG